MQTCEGFYTCDACRGVFTHRDSEGKLASLCILSPFPRPLTITGHYIRTPEWCPLLAKETPWPLNLYGFEWLLELWWTSNPSEKICLVCKSGDLGPGRVRGDLHFRDECRLGIGGVA